MYLRCETLFWVSKRHRLLWCTPVALLLGQEGLSHWPYCLLGAWSESSHPTVPQFTIYSNPKLRAHSWAGWLEGTPPHSGTPILSVTQGDPETTLPPRILPALTTVCLSGRDTFHQSRLLKVLILCSPVISLSCTGLCMLPLTRFIFTYIASYSLLLISYLAQSGLLFYL